jgi:hypothetical protein
MSEKFYPANLIRTYFNYCQANDIKPSFEDMDAFISEVLGTKQINGIPSFKTIKEVFDER